MLPTHGAVTSVFHLANSLRHGSRASVGDWVHSAGTRSSFLSAAIDHRPAAKFLIDAKLVILGAAITLGPKLKALSRQADRATLVAIARLLLELAPPPWLIAAVTQRVCYEFIPTTDLQGLSWLRPELEELLIDSGRRAIQPSDSLALGLGRAGELAIFAALEEVHASPLHVSEISDRFGYDIETAQGHALRWEVKGCTTKTSGSFHLSRNEFEKCRRYPDQWRLVQVAFTPAALTADAITASHIGFIRELLARDLADISPPETKSFYWEGSARITPSASLWASSSLAVPRGFRLPSIIELGDQARELRSKLQTFTGA